MLVIQLILYCLLFFLMVKAAVKDNGMNCLYFYPPAFIDEAARRGLADKDETMKRGKRFIVPFCIIMLVVLVLIIAVWNRVTTFTAAYWQAVLFLVVMNWFDGICMDLVWVAHGKEWAIPGMEGIPYIKPLKSVTSSAPPVRSSTSSSPCPWPAPLCWRGASSNIPHKH